MTGEPTISPDQAALIMLFWTLGAMAIGYGIAVWVYGRREKRRAATAKRHLDAQIMAALLAERDG